MAIHHTLSGEPLAIRPIGSAITSARTVTLYQTRQFEEKTAQLNGESAW